MADYDSTSLGFKKPHLGTEWMVPYNDNAQLMDDLMTVQVGNINSHGGRITVLEGKATADEANIASQGTRITTLEGKAVTDEAAIAELQEADIVIAAPNPTSTVVASVYDETTARYSPFMNDQGRLLQSGADGKSMLVQGQGEQFPSAVLMHELIDGERPLKIIIDSNDRITELWTHEGSHYVATDDGLVNVKGEVLPTLNTLMYQLVDGERPCMIVSDADDGIIQLWTFEGSYYVGSDSGLVKVSSAGSIPFEKPTAYQESADITLFGVVTRVGIATDPNICYILPTMGQSNALAQNGSNDAVLAGASVYPNCLMFTGTSPRRTITSVLTTIPLIEADTGAQSETACSGLATHLVRDIAAATGQTIRTFSFVAAQGGVPYYKLKRGSSAYSIFIQSISDAADICRANGWIPIVPAIDWMQGESDAGLSMTGMTTIWYMREMRQFARNVTEDIRAITGQTVDPIFAITQIAFAPGTEYWNQPVRQAELELDGDENFICPGPLYAFPPVGPDSQSIHTNCLGQNARGQMLARAILCECFGTGWRAFAPKAFRWVSTTVLDIDFECQLGPLVLDTSGTVINMTDLTNYGFLFDDRSGTPPTISTVEVVNSTTIRITLSGAPTGLACRVAYATKSTITDNYGSTAGARGCLRDSSPSVNYYTSTTWYNWCNSFVLEVGHP